MSFSKVRLSLDTARAIFREATIDPIEIGGKVVAYRGIFKGHTYENPVLYVLAQMMVEGNV